MELKYIKTDKNGTKYYEDWNCPRCCGYGELEKWYYTGKVCFQCGGTGKRPHPKIVKIYTEEYQKILDERREKRNAKKQEENPPESKEEVTRKLEEMRKNNWLYEGFNKDGVGFLLTGETYKNKDLIKQSGGRWNRFFEGFVCPTPLQIKDVSVEEIKASEFCNESGFIDMDKAIAHKKQKQQNKKGD